MTAATTSLPPALWQPQRHIPQLDGVRGLAILVVTLYRFSKEIPTDTQVGLMLHNLFALGDRGVDLFFVLSGFLISGILLDAKGNKHYFTSFLARRSLRIFPLYFAALFLFLIASQWIAPFRGMFALAESNQFYLWSYLTNVKMSLDGDWTFGHLDHFWSLAVEEHFYFVWPLLIFFCLRTTALKLACLLAGGSALSRIAFAIFSDNGVAPDVLTLFRCDALLIGALLALQIRTPAGLAPLRWWALALFPLCLSIGLWSSFTDKRLFTLPHTLWPLMWACVLIWLLRGSERRPWAKLFNLSPLRQLGKYSYAMYVFQSPLMPIVAGICSVPLLTSWLGDALVANLVYMAVMFTLTYAAALLSWYLLEQHCMKLKRFFPTHIRPPAAPSHVPSPESAPGSCSLTPAL